MWTINTVKALPLLVLITAGTSVMAQPQPVTDSAAEQEESFADKEGVVRSLDLPDTPEESHSSRRADDEVLQQASQNPHEYIGRMLKLKTGKLVGEITDVRRKLDNLHLYLVVDATPYFNAPTIYAVAVRDVEDIVEGSVIISEDKGMHLRGLTYYEDDYTAAGENFPEQALDDIKANKRPASTE